MLPLHLLKGKYQPNLRGRSWTLTIKQQRRKVTQHLGDNPSLRSVREEAFAEAYGDARLMGARETPMDEDEFPVACPWSFEQAIDADFWPA